MTTFETDTDLGGIFKAAADADATTPKPLAATEETDYESMKVAALKELCKAAGLLVGGKKAELIDRLIESYGATEGDDGAEEDEAMAPDDEAADEEEEAAEAPATASVESAVDEAAVVALLEERG